MTQVKEIGESSSWVQKEAVASESEILPEHIYDGKDRRNLNAFFTGVVTIGVAGIITGSLATPIPWIIGGIVMIGERIRSGHSKTVENEKIAQEMLGGLDSSGRIEA